MTKELDIRVSHLVLSIYKYVEIEQDIEISNRI